LRTLVDRGADRKGAAPVPSRLGEQSSNLPERATPVFVVVGDGKSGTTWVRNVLDAHPEILCRGERRFFGREIVRVTAPEDLSRGWLTSVQPTSLYGAISSSSDLRTRIERAVRAEGEGTDEHLSNLNRIAVTYLLARRLSQTNRRIVGDKTTFAGADEVAEIGALPPEAKAIHTFRISRDVAVSMIHHR
jgi:hypothetical protein